MESSLDPLPESANNNMGNVYDAEGGRGCRNKRKQTHPTFCPVCQCTLRPSDVDQHLHCELEKLQKISKTRSSRLSYSNSSSSSSSGNAQNISTSSVVAPAPTTQASGEHYRKYQQVRSNRQSRQKMNNKRRKLNDGTAVSVTTCNSSAPGPSNVLNLDEGSHGDLQCPICYRLKSRNVITMHVDRCLARSERRRKRKRDVGDNGAADAVSSTAADADPDARATVSRQLNADDTSGESSTTDDDGEGGEPALDNDEIDVEGYEEYEWAGQSRVRVTSLVQGGLASIFPATYQSSSHTEDVDEDLVVDDDDRFGPAQYSEMDMIQCESDMSRERREETLRRAVLSPIIPTVCPPTTAPIFSPRSRSVEPPASEEHEKERFEKRCNSDPLPTSASSSDQTEVPSVSSGPMYSYPVTAQDLPTNSTSNSTSCESVPTRSPPPPMLTPVDMSVPVIDPDGNGSANYEPIPVLEPAVLLHRISIDAVHEALGMTSHPHYVEFHRRMAAVEAAADAEAEAAQAAAAAGLDNTPRLSPRISTWSIVPSLSTIAQDAADRAHIAGANPTPSTSTEQGKPINHLVIQSLFARIRELETRLEGDVCKCLICMDRYRTPVISTICWHVYCEECWLRTLGAKKLCPQCNAITTPNDLRKIYI